MKNEFGIEVQSTTEPKKKLDFNTWVRKFGVSSMYQKRDLDTLDKMNEYDFKKLSKKCFVNNSESINFA